MELDLQSLFRPNLQLFIAALIGGDPANPPPSLPPHLGSYTRALLVSQDRRNLFFDHLLLINEKPFLLLFWLFRVTRNSAKGALFQRNNENHSEPIRRSFFETEFRWQP
jgi:hypothetical protein